MLSNFFLSNTPGQIIVILLLLSSVAAWSIMIYKHATLVRISKASDARFRTLIEEPELLALPLHAHEQRDCTFADVVMDALEAYQKEVRAFGHPTNTASRDRTMRAIENAITRSISAITLQYEKAMVSLGSIVTGAPFLGLLGTVWGVMDAFNGVTDGGGTSIQSLAPGVSGALLTTVCALSVAIPSVIGYNNLISTIKQMGITLENYSSHLAESLEREMVESDSPSNR